MINWMKIPNAVRKIIKPTSHNQKGNDNDMRREDSSTTASEDFSVNDTSSSNYNKLTSSFTDESYIEETSLSSDTESSSSTSNDDEIFVSGKEIGPSLVVVDRLGKGGFGVVYKVCHTIDEDRKEYYAMKVSSKKNHLYDIEHEIFVLNNMKGSPYFCKTYIFGKLFDRTIIVMTMLGSTLNEIRKKQKSLSYSLYTTAALGLQCLGAIEHLHQKFFLHNDIKGHNFATGINENSKNIYLFDFGLSESLVIINRSKDEYAFKSEYEKYRKIPIEQLASDAVFEQAEQAKLQPKTGNRFIDMLHENGIPIGSSLKGIEQALKTQREIENNDPTEQIAKAVFEKFQKQILPGLVANMIAGKNPFQMPGGGPMTRMMAQAPTVVNPNDPPLGSELGKYLKDNFEKSVRRLQTNQFAMNPVIAERLGDNVRRSEMPSTPIDINNNDDYVDDSDEVESFPTRIKHLDVDKYSDNENFDDVFKRRRRPRATDMEESINRLIAADQKAALVLGLNDLDLDSENGVVTNVRKAPIELSTNFKNELVPMMTAEEVTYALSNPEELLSPIKPLANPNPQPGFVMPRKVPKRPRKMLPLIIGVTNDDDFLNKGRNTFLPNENIETLIGNDKSFPEDIKPKSPFLSETRKHPSKGYQYESLIALFEGTDLAEKLDKPSFMSNEQRGYINTRGNAITTYPRMYAAKIFGDEPNIYDKKTKQIVEERQIPPLFFVPKGKHTRLRWVTATEQEIPGIGSRFIIPSLDPTRPAINSVLSTQGKERNEYETTWKIPNTWQSGDIFGISMNTKSEKLIGGDGVVDFPAIGRDVIFG
uniref:Protein kinase domain-containing protein n=1 Tax=Strongyloides stercoralis TaxID=6248 RepID=A0A0K0DS94_STRER